MKDTSKQKRNETVTNECGVASVAATSMLLYIFTSSLVMNNNNNFY